MNIIIPLRWDRSRPLSLEDIRGWRAISYLRFSSSLQGEGDSIERQRVNTERAVEALDLILDRAIEDQAKSASKGIHRKKGELGLLLSAIDAGRIPVGSVLIVEAVDRLTREGLLDVYPMLTKIIRGGMVLLVCGETEDEDEFELYDEHAINGRQGDKLHVDIRSAYKYTKRLSQTAKARHARRRESASRGEQITPNGVPPFWIDRDMRARRRGDPVHTLNEHRCAIVAMFEEAAANQSVRQIADALTRREITDPDGRPWRCSAIGRCLRDDAVIGFWTPIQWIDGKRTPVGPACQVYPEAISSTLWQAVQDSLDQRGGVLRGATGKSVPNLFSGRAVCPVCESAMRVDTGGGIRRGQRKRHLICGNYVEHRGCKEAARYDLNQLERPLIWTLAERLRLAPNAAKRPSEWAERRAALEVEIRQKDDAIAAMMPRVGGSHTLLAHVERLGFKADRLRQELASLMEATAVEVNARGSGRRHSV